MVSEYHVTNMDIRYKEVFFTVNEKSKYKIPSKMYPVSSKKNLVLFHSENTVPLTRDDVIKAIDNIDLPIGRCYSNSERIRLIGEQIGVSLEFYSGWVFKIGDMPKHHAWIVYQHQEGISIIDSLKENLFREAANRYPVDYTQADWRKQATQSVKKVSKELPFNHQQIIIGQALVGMLYVGSPDTIDNARKLYNDTIDVFPNHPSYLGEGDNTQGRSKLQEEFARNGII
ncbi:hypothetical protein PP175_26535 (plasmid) [Aneurinibacillus sp. Ricciae_BoGa-3]|uniref:hypothetical protein n=1 Tax=Aneurinibacillus sp. Ricciae_BoGa-3 TaxID=3022697 RepID=UPI002341C7E8|nr:hypothetical protein [Aneurinibacillus sp. Ricciae_BoGa-3]WCK57623.1 hypothetical protein PP175_26535 [Aneurinibacillus sp. Ricciae_BoGa-3]